MSGSVAFSISDDEAASLAAVERKVVPGRACASCTLCCKVMRIEELVKPAGAWCSHCSVGSGCGIYEARPFGCRAFYCAWMIAKGLGPEWKPDKAKFALFVRNDGARLTAHVDPGSPGAWKREPYYTNFKRWAAEGAHKNPIHLVDVMIGERLIVILPDRDIEFGVLAADEGVEMMRHADGRLDARAVKRAAEKILEPA